jgi:hypothetical protein
LGLSSPLLAHCGLSRIGLSRPSPRNRALLNLSASQKVRMPPSGAVTASTSCARSLRTMNIAPYIVMYVGLGMLFSALVLLLALQFMDKDGSVDRGNDC